MIRPGTSCPPPCLLAGSRVEARAAQRGDSSLLSSFSNLVTSCASFAATRALARFPAERCSVAANKSAAEDLERAIALMEARFAFRSSGPDADAAKAANPGMDSTALAMKLIAEYKALSEEEKQKYKDRAAAEKKAFEEAQALLAEMEEMGDMLL